MLKAYVTFVVRDLGADPEASHRTAVLYSAFKASVLLPPWWLCTTRAVLRALSSVRPISSTGGSDGANAQASAELAIGRADLDQFRHLRPRAFDLAVLITHMILHDVQPYYAISPSMVSTADTSLSPAPPRRTVHTACRCGKRTHSMDRFMYYYNVPPAH